MLQIVCVFCIDEVTPTFVLSYNHCKRIVHVEVYVEYYIKPNYNVKPEVLYLRLTHLNDLMHKCLYCVLCHWSILTRGLVFQVL